LATKAFSGECHSARAAGDAMTTQICEPHEIVPGALRTRLRWDRRHDAMATEVMCEFKLTLPCDRELIRQLTFVRVAQGKVDWL
jgi:hypothetical protein